MRNKCTKNYCACAKRLFCSLDLLFNQVAVVVFLNSVIIISSPGLFPGCCASRFDHSPSPQVDSKLLGAWLPAAEHWIWRVDSRRNGGCMGGLRGREVWSNRYLGWNIYLVWRVKDYGSCSRMTPSCKSPIIEPMASKWRQKCSPLQIIESLTEKTWGQGWVIFGERKNKERNGETPLRRRKYFEWIIKQLLNSAFVGYEEFCRSRRVLSTSAFGLCG